MFHFVVAHPELSWYPLYHDKYYQLNAVYCPESEGFAIATQTQSLLPAFDESRLRHFEGYVAGLRSVFHRADQALRFRAYLRGLLEQNDRKNVEAISASAGQTMMVEADLAQALQHFVSQSPWDSRRLIAALRNQSPDLHRDSEACWVVHDVAFPKKGQHSVGVQRQYARTVGKKINCQLGVFVVQVGPLGYFPLAARLYLPATWLKENAESAEKGIPEEFRQGASKVEIALALIDELRQNGSATRPISGESGYLNDSDFTDGLKSRGLRLQTARTTLVEEAIQRKGWLKSELGLDHFEGRTWHGWHHHMSLVFAAYYLLAAENIAAELPPFSSVPR